MVGCQFHQVCIFHCCLFQIGLLCTKFLPSHFASGGRTRVVIPRQHLRREVKFRHGREEHTCTSYQIWFIDISRSYFIYIFWIIYRDIIQNHVFGSPTMFWSPARVQGVHALQGNSHPSYHKSNQKVPTSKPVVFRQYILACGYTTHTTEISMPRLANLFQQNSMMDAQKKTLRTMNSLTIYQVVEFQSLQHDMDA